MHTVWSASNFEAAAPGWTFVDIAGALERDELWTTEA